MQQEQPLQVARCTKIINADTDNAQCCARIARLSTEMRLAVRYMINVKQIAKFVVALGENVSPMDIEEGMRVGVDRSGKYQVLLTRSAPNTSQAWLPPRSSSHFLPR